MGLFEDKNWLKKLLEDEDVLEQLGLSDTLTDEQIEFIISEIEGNERLRNALNILEDNVMDDEKYAHNIIPYDYNKTPAQNCIAEALLEVGANVNSDDDLENMELGATYLIVFPNKKIIECELVDVVETDLGIDYIFYNISGAEDLVFIVEELGNLDDGLFPVPKQFLYSVIIVKKD